MAEDCNLQGFSNINAGPNINMRWVTCTCGWAYMMRRITANVDEILRRQWLAHAYTPEERSVLRELGGDDIPWS